MQLAWQLVAAAVPSAQPRDCPDGSHAVLRTALLSIAPSPPRPPQRLRATTTAPATVATPAAPADASLVTDEERRLFSAEQLAFLTRKRLAAAGLGPIFPESSSCASCSGQGMRVCHQCGGTGANATDKAAEIFKAEHGMIIQNCGTDMRVFFQEGWCCWLCKGSQRIGCPDCSGTGIAGGVDHLTGD